MIMDNEGNFKIENASKLLLLSFLATFLPKRVIATKNPGFKMFFMPLFASSLAGYIESNSSRVVNSSGVSLGLIPFLYISSFVILGTFYLGYLNGGSRSKSQGVESFNSNLKSSGSGHSSDTGKKTRKRDGCGKASCKRKRMEEPKGNVTSGFRGEFVKQILDNYVKLTRIRRKNDVLKKILDRPEGLHVFWKDQKIVQKAPRRYQDTFWSSTVFFAFFFVFIVSLLNLLMHFLRFC